MKTAPGIRLELTRLVNLLVLVSLWFFPTGWKRDDLNSPTGVWGNKPALSYFVFTASWRNQLKAEAALSQNDWQIVEYIAGQEADHLRALYQSSQRIAQNDYLNLFGKRLLIWLSRYNQQVEKILQQTEVSLRAGLSQDVYFRLRGWIERHWLEEKSRHGLTSVKGFARSYEIYATRYDSGGAYTVALPDKCLKFSNAGNHLCDDLGYAVGQNYTVFLSYKKSTAATVLESGPWNVDDNYWAGWGDPQARRMFADLALGLPEAQAAFFNNYNGGVDQFGRKVTAPYGIDLARQVSIDIGLEPGVNDWITVSYMWTETWGSASAPADPNSTSQASQELQTVQTATVDSTGAIFHEVKFGQTLWAIADAYQVSLQDILALNNLAEDAIIIPGQQLLIRRIENTPSPVQASAFTVEPTRPGTRKPTPTPAFRETSLPDRDSTQLAEIDLENGTPVEGAPSPSNSRNQIIWLIVALLVGGFGLLLIGGFLQR